MQGNKIIMVLLIVTISFCRKGVCQTVSGERNYKYIDSAEQNLKQYACNDLLTYPAKYGKKKIKNDTKLVRVLNNIFQKDFNLRQLDVELSKAQKLKISRNEKMNGLLRVVTIIFNASYVRAELKLECIDDFIVRKKCLLFSTSNGKCGELGYRTLDFNFLKKYILSELNFLIKISDNTHLVAVDFDENNLVIASEKHKDFKFNIPDADTEGWVNKILYNQYNSDSSCCYSFSKAEKSFVDLIKNEKIKVIKDLLYSPNYYYSVQAMEALLYLGSVNKVNIDASMRKRMEIIKQSDFDITAKKSDDLFETVRGYKALLVSDEQVLRKYKNSIQ